MKAKNPIISSIKELPALAKKHKAIIAVIFLLQLIFFSALFIINLKYQLRIYGSALNVMEYMEKQQLGEEAIGIGYLTQQNILGEDPLMIYENYQVIASSVVLLLFFSFLAFVAINGPNWLFTEHLVTKNASHFSSKKKLGSFLIYVGKFAALTLGYSILILLFFYAVFRSSIIEAASAGDISFAAFLPLLLIVPIFYFAFISFAITGKNSLKDVIKKTFLIGAKKAHIIVMAYIINVLAIASASLLLYLSLSLHIAMLMLAMALFLSSFIFSRIFFALVISKLYSKEHEYVRKATLF